MGLCSEDGQDIRIGKFDGWSSPEFKPGPFPQGQPVGWRADDPNDGLPNAAARYRPRAFQDHAGIEASIYEDVDAPTLAQGEVSRAIRCRMHLDESA